MKHERSANNPTVPKNESQPFNRLFTGLGLPGAVCYLGRVFRNRPKHSKRIEIMDQVARSRNISVVMLASVLLAIVLVGSAHQAVGQTASPQTQAFNQNVKDVYFPFN